MSEIPEVISVNFPLLPANGPYFLILYVPRDFLVTIGNFENFNVVTGN